MQVYCCWNENTAVLRKTLKVAENKGVEEEETSITYSKVERGKEKLQQREGEKEEEE